MKTQLTLLATCLLGVQLANGQNTTSTTSTTSTSTYSAPVTDTTQTTGTTYTTSPGTPSTDNAVNATRTTETTVTTPAATNGYTTTTTTTTTTSDDQMSRENRDKTEKPGGKSGKFGIYAGVNISKFVNEPIPDDAFRAGWQAGLYGRTGGTIFGQIGLEYRNSTNNLIRTGPGSTSGSVADQIRGKIDMHFLAIPAYVGARIGNTLGLRVQAGAELASLVAVGPNNFQLGKDDLNRTILNGLLGAGINLGPLTLDVVYNHGLQHVFDDADTKRRIWAFNLGFRF